MSYVRSRCLGGCPLEPSLRATETFGIEYILGQVPHVHFSQDPSFHVGRRGRTHTCFVAPGQRRRERQKLGHVLFHVRTFMVDPTGPVLPSAAFGWIYMVERVQRHWLLLSGPERCFFRRCYVIFGTAACPPLAIQGRPASPSTELQRRCPPPAFSLLEHPHP
jgi:hypothetical protein